MEYSTQSYYCKEMLCHYAEGFSELVRMLKPEEEQKVFEPVSYTHLTLPTKA